MKILKDIFISYDIAVQLKEIGFDEPCMFYYNAYRELMVQTNGTVYWHKQDSVKRYNYNSDGNNEYLVSAPTWEQVKKWFREKGYESNVRAYFGCYYGTIGESEDIQLEQEKTYEEAQEKLILKLIEIYKNDR